MKILIETGYNGNTVASAMVPTDNTQTNLIRVHRIYNGYTRREIQTDFKKYVKTLQF